ncbi:MAG: hypothetical protein SFX74_00475 [Fimbriimonadaceae bacterium]|nr:hypothetical protein [Fimbriimonadaceae bacterium]
MMALQDPTPPLRQVQISYRVYEVGPRFELTAGRFTRAKDGSVTGYVNGKSFDDGMGRLAENRRAKLVSAPMVRTVSGMPAELGLEGGLKLNVTPTAMDAGVSFDARLEQQLGAKQQNWVFSGKTTTELVFVIQFSGFDRKTRVIRMAFAEIKD